MISVIQEVRLDHSGPLESINEFRNLCYFDTVACHNKELHNWATVSEPEKFGRLQRKELILWTAIIPVTLELYLSTVRFAVLLLKLEASSEILI